MNATHLECALCGLPHEANTLQNLCITCGKPLLVRYDLEKAAKTLTSESLSTRESTLWHYREVLPVVREANIVIVGEGWYCRYFLGRRSLDDRGQIGQWRAIRRRVAQIQKNCPSKTLDCRPRQR